MMRPKHKTDCFPGETHKIETYYLPPLFPPLCKTVFWIWFNPTPPYRASSWQYTSTSCHSPHPYLQSFISLLTLLTLPSNLQVAVFCPPLFPFSHYLACCMHLLPIMFQCQYIGVFTSLISLFHEPTLCVQKISERKYLITPFLHVVLESVISQY